MVRYWKMVVQKRVVRSGLGRGSVTHMPVTLESIVLQRRDLGVEGRDRKDS